MKILSLIFCFPLLVLLLELLIGRAEFVYAREKRLRGLLTRKQRGIFSRWGFSHVPLAAAPIDYPVAKKEAQNS